MSEAYLRIASKAISSTVMALDGTPSGTNVFDFYLSPYNPRTGHLQSIQTPYPGHTRAMQNSLDDFPEGQFTILVFCDACGRSAPLDRSKVPAGTGIQKLPSILRCSSCGSRDASMLRCFDASMRIIYTGAGGYHHEGGPMPPDSEPTA